MNVYANQLATQLAGELASIYVLSGEEPLLLMEAADAVRRAARDRGYLERTVLAVDKRFDWRDLSAAASHRSLFTDRRVLNLRLESCRLGKDGGDALRRYAQRPPPDTLLLVTAPRLDSAAQRSVWFKALAAQGVSVRLWPPARQEFPQWLERRLRARGLLPEREAVHILAERVEGNLLAAAQEVDKLALLYGAGAIAADTVMDGVMDSARFDVYGLIDSALQGETARALHMLQGLRAEGVAVPVIVGALARELRGLGSMAFGLARGESLTDAIARLRVFDRRKALVGRALQRLRYPRILRLMQRCALVDSVLKGRAPGREWDGLGALVTDLARQCR